MATSEQASPQTIVPGAPPEPVTEDEARGIPLVDALADEADDAPQPAPVNREAIQARIDALLLKAEAPDRSKVNAQVAELRKQLERV